MLNIFFQKPLLKNLITAMIVILSAAVAFACYYVVRTEYKLNILYEEITKLSALFAEHLNKGKGEETSAYMDPVVVKDIHEAYYKGGVKKTKCWRNYRNVFGGDFKILYAQNFGNSQHGLFKIITTKIPYRACVRFLSRPWPQNLGKIYALDGNLYQTPVSKEKAAEVCMADAITGNASVELYREMPSQNAVLSSDNPAGIYIFQPQVCPCGGGFDFEALPNNKNVGSIFTREVLGR